MRYLAFLIVLPGCGLLGTSVKESAPEIIEGAEEAGRSIAADPSWTNILAQVGGLAALVVGAVWGGKKAVDINKRLSEK